MKVSTHSCMDERDCQNRLFSFTYRQEPAWVWGSWYIANVATCQIRIAIPNPNCQNKKVIGVAHWRNQHTVNFQSVSKVHASSRPKWTTLFSTHLSTLSSSSVCVPITESSRSGGKPYPHLCNERRPRLKPRTFRSRAVRLYRLHQARPSIILCVHQDKNSEIIRLWNASHSILCFTKIKADKVQRIRAWSNAEAR